MKNVLITGISRGLGYQLAEHFLEQGCAVWGVSRTLTPELSQLQARYPDALQWYPIDLSDTHQLEQRLLAVLPLVDVPIHVFIDNAAVLYKELVHRLQAEPLSQMMTLNVVVPMLLTKLVIANFLKHKTRGSIVHISSICAHRAFNGLSMMGATKAAIEAFSRTTAAEYGRFGIRSNTVVVGLLEIGMRSTVNERLTAGLRSISSLRQLVDAQSVVGMIDYLASDSSHCITGACLHIDAGIV